MFVLFLKCSPPRLKLLAAVTLTLCASLPAFAERGFYTIHETSIPGFVRQSAQSVIKTTELGSVTGAPDFVIDTYDEAALGQQKALLAANESRAAQFAFCQREHLRFCPIFSGVTSASAFPLNDSQTLYTALHVFFDSMIVQIQKRKLTTAEQIFSAIQNFPIGTIMEDVNHDLLFGSNSNRAVVQFFNPDPVLYSGAKLDFRFRLSDILRLHLSSPLPLKPLRLAVQPARVNDVVYGVGYPDRTTDRKTRFGVPDSDGESLRITRGHVISSDEYVRRIGAPALTAFERLILDRYMIFTDYDSEGGASGGPILNEQGEVVGVFSSQWADVTDRARVVSGGIREFNEAKLRSFWQSLR